jgi:hypothetical protein
MSKPTKILMQTTIQTVEDDWSIARFSWLRVFLTGLPSQSGAVLFEVTARDRGPLGIPDPVLSNLNNLDFASLWLFGVDTGDGLTKENCRGIPLFRKRGGGILATRDHMDLGCSLCSLGGIGDAHHFPSKNVDRDVSRRVVDGPYTTNILWPNFHSGANGDFQEIAIVAAPSPSPAFGRMCIVGNSLAQACFQRLLVQDAVVTHAVDEECRSTVHPTTHAPHEVALHVVAKPTRNEIVLET